MNVPDDSVPGRVAPAGAFNPELDPHLVSLLSPRSFEADQYRILRHFLDQVTGVATRRVLAVTSPAPGDGKTTTAVNLAATLGQSPDVRVLLVDVDLRRSLVARTLGLDPAAPGLATGVVDQDADLGAIVQSTPYNFDVLTAGPPPANAYQVLESPRVGQLLDQARSAYDYVVLDTPPVLLVPDCRLMEQRVDSFLVVVAAHRTPRKLLAETLNALEPDKVLGIVFNRDERPLSGYYKQYSGYYHAPPASSGSGWWPSWAGRGEPRP